MNCRVFQNPDSSLRVMRLNERHRSPGETDTEFFTRETAKQPALVVLPFVDIDVAGVPVDRSKRYAWRISAGSLVVDTLVPTPPHPKQALLDEIASATTIVALRAALTKAVQG